MNRSDTIPYVSFVVDDSLAGRSLGQDLHAEVKDHSWLIGWQCGFEPLFVAVHSYLPGVTLDCDDAIQLAVDYLQEREWFTDNENPPEPDYVISPERTKE